MSEEQTLEGYCFKCREKRDMVDPQAEWAANGSPGTRGTCPVCGGTIYKTGNTPAHEHLPKPEIKPRPKKSKKKGKKSKTKTKRRSGKLVIVESPAKARTIGRYLGSGYTVKSSVGHVRDLLRSRLSVDVEHDFEPEYRVPNDKRKLVKELKAAGEKAKEIYLATDPDREGEAIAWHVRESAEMEPERTQRVVFHEITKPAIQEAFERPRGIDMDRVDAQQARRILDRLVGYKLSPLLWRKVHGRLSAGRVQSVAVRLVVEREREIENFVAQESWTITAHLDQTANGDRPERPYFEAKLHRYKGEEPVLSTEEDVLPHLEVLGEADWQAGAVKLGTRRRRPAAPFTTSTLQQEASRKLSFGTSKTMRIAQQLYEGASGDVGLITYMRTDSVSISQSAQDEARNYIEQRYGEAYRPAKPPKYRTKAKGAQEAHEAVRPTSVMRTPKQLKPSLKRDQYRLYKLIWDRFVASQMSAAVYDTVRADIHAGDKDVAAKKRPYKFRATGSTLSFRGFLALYEESRPADKPEDEGLAHPVPPELTQGEQLDLINLVPNQHFTQPPPRFSEATLVKAMEEDGIGRPSTYASTISTIISRGYVDRENRRLVPTETGQIVNDMLVEHFPDILSVDFTARLEGQLDEIAEGKEWVPVLRDFYERFTIDLEKADESIERVDIRRAPEPVGRDCPVCGNPLVFREGRYGRFIGCSTYPKCRHTEQVLDKIDVVCPHGQGDIVQRKNRRGRTFYGCSKYPECKWLSNSKPLAEISPDCDGLMVPAKNGEPYCKPCGLLESEKEKEVQPAKAT